MEQKEIDKLKEEIKNFIESDEYTTLKLEAEDDDFMLFATRENGDVGEELSSQEDFDDAWAIRNKLLKQYGEEITINVEDVNEWVHLNIYFN